MKGFSTKFYIVGFFSLIIMGGVVVYTFRTLFDSLTTAFEVEAQIPESELRIDRQSLEKAYDYAYETEPTKLNLETFENKELPESDSGVVDKLSEEESD